jgi:hypothetical protein
MAPERFNNHASAGWTTYGTFFGGDLMNAKQQDVGLILKLYELRRDEMMRRARNWYVTEFQPESAKDIIRLMISGQEQSAYYRMVTSYWDMAASLVNNGGIDEKMFLEANTEHIGIFASEKEGVCDS